MVIPSPECSRPKKTREDPKKKKKKKKNERGPHVVRSLRSLRNGTHGGGEEIESRGYNLLKTRKQKIRARGKLILIQN